MSRRLRTLAPPVVLILLVVAIAGAVHTYASPPGGLQLPVMEKEDADAGIRTGKTPYPREAIDGDDVTVRMVRPAHRIVSQYWSIDEFAYSVLLAQDVVAVSESAYAEEISNVLARGRARSRSDAGIDKRPCRLHQPRSQLRHTRISHANHVRNPRSD
jgi:hypothetical protein